MMCRASIFPKNPVDRGPGRALLFAALILAGGLVLRLWIASWPLERLISTFVADDAFYYTEIARNILQQKGSTFDGVIATNGYHPLWMLFCVVFQAMAGPDPEAVLRLMLVVNAFLGIFCGVLLVMITHRHVAPAAHWAAPLVALFWAFNPFVACTEMMGVEAPLALAFLLAALLSHEAVGSVSLRRVFLTGTLCGFAFLARTDAGVFGAMVFFSLMIRAWNERIGISEILRRAAAFAIPAGLAASSWLLWSLARFGTIWQDSGRVLPYRVYTMDLASGRGLLAFIPGAANKGLYDYLLRLTGGINPPATVLFMGLAAGVVLCVMAFRRVPAGRVPRLLLAYAVFVWIFYILVFRQHKFWYFLPLMAALALLLARVSAYAVEVCRDAPAAARPVAAVLFAFVLAGQAAHLPRVLLDGYHPWQSVYLKAARDMKEGVVGEDGALVGAFNSGIYGAFSGRRVINLDGVVNPNIIKAMRRKRFGRYLREAGIREIVDHERLIAQYSLWSGPDFHKGFELLHRYETPPFSGDVLLLRVLP